MINIMSDLDERISYLPLLFTRSVRVPVRDRDNVSESKKKKPLSF